MVRARRTPRWPSTYTYAGEAESPDGKATSIDAKNADGFSARLFIDQETKLPLMVTYQGPQPRMITQRGPVPGAAAPQHGGGQQAARREMTDEDRQKMRAEAEKQLKELQSQPPQLVDYSLYFEDWREVDGVKFPHKIRRAMSGATNEEWTINKVKVNPKIDSEEVRRLKGAVVERDRSRGCSFVSWPRRWCWCCRRQPPRRRGARPHRCRSS